MSKIMEAYNGREVEYRELINVDRKICPTPTNSYTPIMNHEVVETITDQCRNILPNNYIAESSQYVLAREDKHFFGLHTYRNGETGIKLAVGFCNSYDKQISLKVACGSQVQVCTNLMITGDVFVMRKHTKYIDAEYKDLVGDALSEAHMAYHNSLMLRDEASQMEMTDDRAYKFLGLLAGHNVLGTRQFKKAMHEWKKPSYDHGIGTAWTFYNAVTEAMKTSQVRDNITKLSQFNTMFKKGIINLYN